MQPIHHWRHCCGCYNMDGVNTAHLFLHCDIPTLATATILYKYYHLNFNVSTMYPLSAF
jgi:ABC-type glucose/galactose transport system permease subunit